MPSIKKPKYVDDTIVEEEDDRTLEDLVKEVSLEEFLNCKKTREILQDEAYWKFEKRTKYRIAKIYEDYNNLFGNKFIFKKDWDNEMGNVIADICYEHTADNYDVTIFHHCPELAAPVFR